MHFKLTLSYDGSAYHGWQVQPDRATIQGTLSAAIHHLTGETVLPQGSGRTDAGVHALAQVTTFSLATNIPAENLLRALNRALPPSIRVLTAEYAPDTFHARYSALRKTYEYRIFYRKPQSSSLNDDRVPQGFSLGSHRSEMEAGFSPQGMLSRICPPFLAPYVWDCPWPLALEPMQLATSQLLGTHDFTSFAASDPDLTTRSASVMPAPQTGYPEPLGSGLIGQQEVKGGIQRLQPLDTSPNTRTLFHSHLTLENDLLHYRVTGSGFLHHMVRNIVGTLVEIGRGALPADSIPAILAARDRSSAGPTAPPQGLFLISVDYPNH
jgi:tRNA pseudouridine38-40 synthase